MSRPEPQPLKRLIREYAARLVAERDRQRMDSLLVFLTRGEKSLVFMLADGRCWVGSTEGFEAIEPAFTAVDRSLMLDVTDVAAHALGCAAEDEPDHDAPEAMAAALQRISERTGAQRALMVCSFQDERPDAIYMVDTTRHGTVSVRFRSADHGGFSELFALATPAALAEIRVV